jgi:hypothetical protein
MLYNTGTPSLVSYTRDIAGDPASAASEMWSDARVKAAINDAYLEMREVARSFGEGIDVKRSYATTVANQLWYSLPSDFKRLLIAEVDPDGGDLSASASPVVLQPMALDAALEGYETSAFSGTNYVAMGSGHIALVNPVSTGGSNSLRLTYEAEPSVLSDDDDEPAFPEVHQYLICYKAAFSLKLSEGLPVNDIIMPLRYKEQSFRNAMQERMTDPEGKVSVAGLIDKPRSTVFGTVYRRK